MINLTPHPIHLRAPDGVDMVFPPSGDVARVAVSHTACGEIVIGGVLFPVVTTTYGDPTGLPDEGIPCLVSSMVAAAVPGRLGVYAPDSGATCIRDGDGRIQAVTRLVAA